MSNRLVSRRAAKQQGLHSQLLGFAQPLENRIREARAPRSRQLTATGFQLSARPDLDAIPEAQQHPVPFQFSLEW